MRQCPEFCGERRRQGFRRALPPHNVDRGAPQPLAAVTAARIGVQSSECMGGEWRQVMRSSRVRALIRTSASLALTGAALAFTLTAAAADTLEWALVQAYQNNPSLNAQRAALRALEENVPQALSGYRPKLSITANGGYNYTNATSQFPIGGTLITVPFAETFYPRSIGATATQTLFNGFQTA